MARELYAGAGRLTMELGFDPGTVGTPCYLVDEAKLVDNLQILKNVMDRTGCKILLAQKAFSMYYFYPLIGKYLSGTSASGLFEAKLGHEEMGKENHVFSAAYDEREFGEIVRICDHIVFNSFTQLDKYRGETLLWGRKAGIRINPECSTQDGGKYDPCAPGSRLGVTIANFSAEKLDGVSGIHFHTLCEQNADALITTLKAVEEKFGAYLKDMTWVNFGGGHHITRADYDVFALVGAVNRFKKKYGVDVYLEPGEAVALGAGYLVATVLDIVQNDVKTAVLDTSCACHMPDVLEMPYRPEVAGAGLPGEKAHTYRLSGATCLAGDTIGDYSFDKPLKPGDRVVFCDMAHYTMVKNNTFNGVNLPSIAVLTAGGNVETVKAFGYENFKNRLS